MANWMKKKTTHTNINKQKDLSVIREAAESLYIFQYDQYLIEFNNRAICGCVVLIRFVLVCVCVVNIRERENWK